MMRTILLGCLCLLAGLPLGQVHAEPPAATKEALSAWIVNGELFLMAPRRGGQDYAISGTNLLWAPRGDIKSLDGNYDLGFRIGAGYRFPGEGVEATFNYSHLHTASEQALSRPDGGTLLTTLAHPTSLVRADSAEAAGSTNFNLFDIEIGKRLDLTDTFQARLFAGPRFGNLDQRFSVGYSSTLIRDDVLQRLTFDGGGMRVGADSNWQLLEFLGVYLRGSASLLAGRFRAGLTETTNAQTLVDVTERFTRVVPIVDLGCGLSYQRGGMRVSVGYEFMNWFGVVHGLDFADDAQPGKLNTRVGDLGFDGVVFRAEWLF